MDEHKVFENIVRARPSCIVNLDNEHLAQEIVRNLNGILIIK